MFRKAVCPDGLKKRLRKYSREGRAKHQHCQHTKVSFLVCIATSLIGEEIILAYLSHGDPFDLGLCTVFGVGKKDWVLLCGLHLSGI